LSAVRLISDLIRGNNGGNNERIRALTPIFFALQRADDIADWQLHQGS
jgi:hypothetical protein